MALAETLAVTHFSATPPEDIKKETEKYRIFKNEKSMRPVLTAIIRALLSRDINLAPGEVGITRQMNPCKIIDTEEQEWLFIMWVYLVPTRALMQIPSMHSFSR